MRAEGVLLLLVLPACSVAQVSNAARVGLVLGAFGGAAATLALCQRQRRPAALIDDAGINPSVGDWF